MTNAICAFPIPGWRLDSVTFDERDGQRDGWVVSLRREGFTNSNYYLAMARSDLGPLEAWDEALRIAHRADAQAIEARRAETLGSVHESAVPKECAPKPSPSGG